MAGAAGRPAGSEVHLPPWAVVTPARHAHIEGVAALLGRWARALALSPSRAERWLRAAWLHDALRDADLGNVLAHGPAAADRAWADGERDPGVLDAIRYHSVGWRHWDDVGRALYCADYLEPGRSFHDAPLASLADGYPSDPDRTLIEVARRRVGYGVLAGYPLGPETVAFWNSLCSDG